MRRKQIDKLFISLYEEDKVLLDSIQLYAKDNYLTITGGVKKLIRVGLNVEVKNRVELPVLLKKRIKK
jgi:hypothetical protein